jgi:hypothetical protein
MLNENEKRPSQLGTAIRSEEKTIRTSTHLSVLSDLFSIFSLSVVLEHGMGKSSTSFFHKTVKERLVSIENSPIWGVCEHCGGGSKIAHDIRPFNDVNQIALKDIELSFIDGEEQERKSIHTLSVDAKVRFIIEHDVESLTKKIHDDRVTTLKSSGYKIIQRVDENPETMLAFRNVIDHNLFFSSIKKTTNYRTL